MKQEEDPTKLIIPFQEETPLKVPVVHAEKESSHNQTNEHPVPLESGGESRQAIGLVTPRVERLQENGPKEETISEGDIKLETHKKPEMYMNDIGFTESSLDISMDSEMFE